MRLKVPLYRQTTDFTCGACATLMVWRYFDRKVQFSTRNEFWIWSEIAALPFEFSSPYRIAAFFIKKGFETKLIMKQRRGPYNRTPLECCQVNPAERKIFLDFFRAYNAILKREIASTIMDRDPTLCDVRRAIYAHSPAILLIDSYYTAKTGGVKNPPHLPHWIVVTGCDGEKFHINDSIYEHGLKLGRVILEERILRRAMDTYRKFGWAPAMIIVSKTS